MNPKEPFVITISREIGSGGHTVGQFVADKLNVRYCDKNLIKALEQKFDLSAGKIEKLKGEKRNWLDEFFQHVSPFTAAPLMGVDAQFIREFTPEVTTDDIYRAETEILREIAEEGSCVIAGRSGFFVFREHPNHLSVFIKASYANRVARVMKKQNMTEEQARALIDKIDKARENYIKRYTGTSRYDARNYDLVLSADGHSEEQLANIILAYINSK
ncbi:MAG: cytidylate kinase-like family protein [Bacteroidales bacterium]|nr:cytidylate kinase-like family protein [Bacteroidales bacterium]